MYRIQIFSPAVNGFRRFCVHFPTPSSTNAVGRHQGASGCLDWDSSYVWNVLAHSRCSTNFISSPLLLIHFSCLWYGFYGARYYSQCYELYALSSELASELLWREVGGEGGYVLCFCAHHGDGQTAAAQIYFCKIRCWEHIRMDKPKEVMNLLLFSLINSSGNVII